MSKIRTVCEKHKDNNGLLSFLYNCKKIVMANEMNKKKMYFYYNLIVLLQIKFNHARMKKLFFEKVKREFRNTTRIKM